VRRVEPDFNCKNLASAVISQKTREANHNKRAIWRLSRAGLAWLKQERDCYFTEVKDKGAFLNWPPEEGDLCAQDRTA